MSTTPSPRSQPDTARLPDFDPRSVPVEGIDAHLPPVPVHQQTPQALRARFGAPPVWEPELTSERRFSDRAPAHAAVLVPIVQRDQPTVLLTERTAHLSTHSGQIAFPGGKADPEDASPADTALREAHEEVGLERRYVEVLGALVEVHQGLADQRHLGDQHNFLCRGQKAFLRGQHMSRHIDNDGLMRDAHFFQQGHNGRRVDMNDLVKRLFGTENA